MTIWQQPQHFPSLKNNQVHIWRANLELPNSEIEKLTTLLSTDEIVRANRFHFPQHKKRFIAARGILRQLLGNYLGINATNLVFTYGDCGKPWLTGDFSLQFNISHSQEYVLLGFTRHHLIGVDLEYQRIMPDALKIAERFFSPRESQLLRETKKETQPQLFFQLWTAKEAYLKAMGTGLSGSLANTEIALDHNQSPYLSIPEEDSTTNWSLYSCLPATNYQGAIAINTNISSEQINYWHY